jgi:hypothetical protein
MTPDLPPTPMSDDWPALLRLRPAAVVAVVGVLVILAWGMVVWVDLLDMVARGDRFKPVWQHLFNDRPVEWMQWFLLPAATVTAAYLSGRLHALGDRGAANFFLLFSIATGLMMIEDAGDIRHVISDYVEWIFGERILGLPVMVVTDVPYFALLAAVPIYALVRHGRDAWRSPGARPYLVLGFGLYALAGGASGIRHLGDLYVRVGRRLDAWFLGGRFPAPDELTQERAHFLLVDSLVEESVEAMAAACFLALVLAFAADLRRGELEPRRAVSDGP